MLKPLLVLLISFILFPLSGQEADKVLKSIFDEALVDLTAYNQLEYLCKNTKGRIPGSPAAAQAVEYARQALIKAGADSVWLQRIPVPKWERGFEQCRVVSSVLGSENLTIAALGLSVGTSEDGIISRVLEVHDFEELKTFGRKNIEGRIVFFNRPVDNTLINSFSGYGGAVNQRTQGALEASKYGAVRLSNNLSFLFITMRLVIL